MNMEITQRIETRVDVQAIAVRMTGDYQRLNYAAAWKTLCDYCQAAGISCDCEEAEYINIYHDNPETTPPDQCRVDVCIAAPSVEQAVPTDKVRVITVYGGRYLVYFYKGPYENLGEVNARVYGEMLPQSGEKVRMGAGVMEHCQMFERYCNDPGTTLPKDLITEIWIPVE